jgi:predicted DNA-binding transcriptional regulator AlpA
MSIESQPESATESVTPLAVSVKKGASMVGVSLSTMWTLIRQGKIPTKKVGMRTLLRVRDLEEFSDGGNVEIDQPAAKPAAAAHRKPLRVARRAARQ